MSWILTIYLLSVVGVTIFFIGYFTSLRKDKEFYKIIFLSHTGLFFVVSVALAYTFSILSLLALSAPTADEYRFWIRVSIISVRWGILLFLMFLETLRNEHPNMMVTSLVSALVFSSSITFLFRTIDVRREEGIWVRTVPFRNLIDLMDSALAVSFLVILAVEIIYTIYTISRIRIPKPNRFGVRIFFVGIAIIFFGVLLTLVAGLVIRGYTLELILLQYLVLGLGAILVGLALAVSPYIMIAATTKILGIAVFDSESFEEVIARFYVDDAVIQDLMGNIKEILQSLRWRIGDVRMLAISRYKILIHYNKLVYVLVLQGQYHFVGKIFDAITENIEEKSREVVHPRDLVSRALGVFDRLAPAPTCRRR